MPIVFDGPNTTITLESGATDVEVRDIYSRWKDWVKIGDNAKYHPAFRTVGGDPLSPVVDAGRYFFLQNQYGWRIKPPEEDITIFVSGNLALEDNAQQGLIATTGPYSTAILGLQPVTQGVTESMKLQLEYASFVNGVWVDQTNGTSGVGYTSDGKPIGCAEVPVDNFTQARFIAEQRGLPRTFYVKGSASLGAGDDVSNYKLVGENAIRTMLTVSDAAITNNCHIIDVMLTGNLDGNTLVERSVLQNVNYVNGFVYKCMLNPGTITLGGTNVAFFLDCYSGVPGSGTPVIDMDGAGGENTPLAMRNYNGGIELIQKTGDAAVTIDLGSGQVKIDMTSVVNGEIVVRGDGKLSDQDGDNINTGVYGSLDIKNGLNCAEHINDVWQRMGLDKDNPVTNNNDGSFSVGNITVDATPSGTSIIQSRQ